MPTHGGVHAPAVQLRPAPHELPQPPQCFALLFGSTQPPPHRTCGAVQVGVTQLLPLHTLPPVQSPSAQHSKQPVAQHLVPVPQPECEHTPAALQLSVVQGSESPHWLPEQHSRQSLPQSLGVRVAHWQLDAEQMAPGLHTVLHPPQCCGSVVRSTSQPSAAWLLQLANPVRQLGSPFTHC
jgi:hypothetical protein